MSYHFSANQFEREFNPKRLGNWEVSKWHPERPRQRFNKTRIIADDRGHLLPGIPRFTEKAQQRYITAWDFPRKISRKFAEDIAKPPRWKVAAWAQEGKDEAVEGEPSGEPEETQQPSSPLKERIFEREVLENEEVRSLVGDKVDENIAPAGELEPLKNHIESEVPESEPVKATEKEPGTPESIQARDNKTLGEDVLIKGGKVVEGNIEEGTEDKMKEASKFDEVNLQVIGTPPPSNGKSNLKKNGHNDMPPLAAAYSPFLVAKQFAEDNLRHHPLPDMVSDPEYRHMETRVKHPGTVLPVPPRATAVSIRHKGAGPTHCTKSSIFRTVQPPAENPSTAIAPLGCKEEVKPKKKYNPRITDMDLAIGWDIKENGHGHAEPTRTAPSVFNIVRTINQPTGDCILPGGCGTPPANESVKSPLQQKSNHIEDAPCSSKQNTPPDSKPPSALNSKPSTPSLSKPPSSQSSKQSSKNSNLPTASKPFTPPQVRNNSNKKTSSLRSWERFGMPPVKRAWEEKENNNPNTFVASQNQFQGEEIKTCMPNGTESLFKVNNIRKRRSQSSPNLSRNSVQPQFQRSNAGINHKSCSACQDDSKSKTNTSPKNSESSSYKMAFKAGKLDNNRPNTAHPSGSGSLSSSQQELKIPKPRPPFARRSYSISTLAPPFSLWPGNHKRGGQDYPDHWRLASVYQHAYKPIQNRTRPLLSTVYQ